MLTTTKTLYVLSLVAFSSFAGAGEYCWSEGVAAVVVQGDEIYFTTNKSCPGWCRVNPNWSVEAKKRAYAMLLTAKATDKPLSFYLNEHATSCAGPISGAMPTTILL